MKVVSYVVCGCCMLALSGCFIHTRDVITAEVKYAGDYTVKTANKYRVVKLSSFFAPYIRTRFNTVGANDGELPPSVVLRSQTTLCGNQELAGREALEKLQSDLESALPDVFSQDGLPFEVTEGDVGVTSDFGNFYFLHILSFGLVPGKYSEDMQRVYTVALNDSSRRIESKFPVHNSQCNIQSGFLPLAVFLSFDKIEETGHITLSQTNWNSSSDANRMATRKHHRLMSVAYGIAVKLKELEDAGKIDAAKLKERPPVQLTGTDADRKVAQLARTQSYGVEPQSDMGHATTKPQHRASSRSAAYRIVSFDRESGSEFAYRFVLALLEENSSLQTLRSVQQEFRLAVKSDYAESFPGVDARSLYVDFPEYKLNDGKISGRAVVLSISVSSLSYDPNTRKGRLAVKVNANQYEEARKWIRKNIETLARDKNIALVTGEIPPAAKFYLGREELKDGNVLEIEFKTE